MKLTITKPTEVEAKYLEVCCGSRLEYKCMKIGDKTYEGTQELFQDYPLLCSKIIERSDELMLIVDIDTGEVINWPKGVPCDMHNWKIVDEGMYKVIDKDRNEIVCYEGYVPSCMDIPNIGYGDYFEFEIDETGHIVDWEFDQCDLDELCEIKFDYAKS